MNRLLLIGIFLFSLSIPSYAQFIDAGFGTGPFSIKQYYTGLFGTGNTSGGGIPSGSLQDDSGHYIQDDASHYIIAG